MTAVQGLRDRAAALLAVATGGLLLRLVALGAHTAYVRASTGWLLALAGVVLLVAGGSALLSPDDAREQHAAHDGHGSHLRLPPAAVLLVLPLLLLALVAPPSLGVYYAEHAAGSSQVVARSSDEKALPDGGGPVALTLRETVARSSVGSSLEGRSVLLTGFVAGTDSEGRALLTRFNVRCCAADARPVQVPVELDSEVPPKGTWMTVVGRWTGQGAVLQASTAEAVDEPADPYET